MNSIYQSRQLPKARRLFIFGQEPKRNNAAVDGLRPENSEEVFPSYLGMESMDSIFRSMRKQMVRNSRAANPRIFFRQHTKIQMIQTLVDRLKTMLETIVPIIVGFLFRRITIREVGGSLRHTKV